MQNDEETPRQLVREEKAAVGGEGPEPCPSPRLLLQRLCPGTSVLGYTTV